MFQFVFENKLLILGAMCIPRPLTIFVIYFNECYRAVGFSRISCINHKLAILVNMYIHAHSCQARSATGVVNCLPASKRSVEIECLRMYSLCCTDSELEVGTHHDSALIHLCLYTISESQSWLYRIKRTPAFKSTG